MRRLAPVSVAVFATMIVFAAVAIPARAGDDVATTITLRTATATVDGKAITVHARLVDAGGVPLAGRLLRLVASVEFMGATKSEIVGEGTTDETGRAAIRFAPAQTGTMHASVTFWGGHGYAPSEAPVTLDVVRPVVRYDPPPVGFHAPWTRVALVPLPFLAVWLTYMFVVSIVIRMRRAGGISDEASTMSGGGRT